MYAQKFKGFLLPSYRSSGSYSPSSPSWTSYPISQNKFWSCLGTRFCRLSLCVYQLKAAPSNPGCYVYYNVDIPKTLRRITDFSKWIEEERRRYHTAFTSPYLGSEFWVLLCLPNLFRKKKQNHVNTRAKNYSPGVFWGSQLVSCTKGSSVTYLGPLN